MGMYLVREGRYRAQKCDSQWLHGRTLCFFDIKSQWFCSVTSSDISQCKCDLQTLDLSSGKQIKRSIVLRCLDAVENSESVAMRIVLRNKRLGHYYWS